MKLSNTSVPCDKIGCFVSIDNCLHEDIKPLTSLIYLCYMDNGRNWLSMWVQKTCSIYLSCFCLKQAAGGISVIHLLIQLYSMYCSRNKWNPTENISFRLLSQKNLQQELRKITTFAICYERCAWPNESQTHLFLSFEEAQTRNSRSSDLQHWHTQRLFLQYVPIPVGLSGHSVSSSLKSTSVTEQPIKFSQKKFPSM